MAVNNDMECMNGMSAGILFSDFVFDMFGQTKLGLNEIMRSIAVYHWVYSTFAVHSILGISNLSSFTRGQTEPSVL